MLVLVMVLVGIAGYEGITCALVFAWFPSLFLQMSFSFFRLCLS
jgi:hypothetical protein